METNFTDIQSICFTCLSSENSLIHVTEEHEDFKEFVNMYEKVTSVSLEVADMVVCDLCIRKLNDSFCFRQMCIDSYISLQNLQQEPKTVLEEYTTNGFNSKEASLIGEYECDNIVDLLEIPNNSIEVKYVETIDLAIDNNHCNQDVTCSVCYLQFESKAEYNAHCTLIHQSNDYRCGICNEEFNLPKLLSNHLRTTHRKDKTKTKSKYVCSRCNKMYRTVDNLKLHIYTHTGIKPFSCKYCDKRFIRLFNLTIHETSHTADRPEICHVCGKRFATASILERHSLCHLESKPFKCSLCKSSFTHSGDLKIHMRCHSGERPYKCERCEKQFRRRSHLVIHKRIHTGEKPYKCLQCDKSFAQTGDLSAHKRTHTGEAPYSCNYCGKCFKQSSARNSHLRIHLNPQSLMCNICSKRFFSENAMLKHVCMSKTNEEISPKIDA